MARGPDAQAEGLAVMSYNRPSKLYVIVIDHPSAQPLAASSSAAGREKARAEKALAMRCLGLLASCRAVGLIAATTSINTICQACDLDTLSLFNWAYVHCPTYEPAIVELSAKDFGVNFATYTSQRADIALEGEDATADNASFTNLKFVINSLTRKHKDMLRVLCNYSQEEERRTKADGKSAAAPAMLWSRFVGVCTDSLIVRGDPDMRYLMRELIEHRLVAQSVGDGPKSVCLVCPAQVLITLL